MRNALALWRRLGGFVKGPAALSEILWPCYAAAMPASARSAATATKRPEQPPPRRQAIYAVVRQIPKGKVATYRQVAQQAGIPNGARQVGYALAALEGPNLIATAQTVPWQRVVNRHGEISYSFARGGGDDLQRLLLLDEGITFDAAGRIDLAVFGWRP